MSNHLYLLPLPVLFSEDFTGRLSLIRLALAAMQVKSPAKLFPTLRGRMVPR